MKTVLRILALPPVSGFLALLLVAGAILWLGEALPFSSTVRHGIVGALVLLWLALSGLWWWRKRRRNAAMLADIAPERDGTGEAIDAERADLESKFAASMKTLSGLRFRGRFGGKRYLYELPWYVFIGPPAAGKTEALKNCGLEFPLARDGDIDIEGGAGTRNCNWIFTNDAVFIDTAGRYTAQGSDAEVDGAAWDAFLGLLGRHRPREPLNGIIVTISIQDIAAAPETEIDAHADAVRARLAELSKTMKANPPVYMLFTKMDLIVGFSEFFRDMRQEDREQVWGATFPLGGIEETPEPHLAGIERDMEGLVGRLGEMQFERLQNEADLAARAKIFNFSAQFDSLTPVVARFMRRAFTPDRYSDPALLRGFYFASATQIGQPVDRLIASFARDFGVERRAIETQAPGSGRAYFIADLLRDVVFPEAGLVRRTTRAARPWGRYAGIAACLLAPLLLGAGLWAMSGHNDTQRRSFAATLDAYGADLAQVETARIDTGDPLPVLPALARLRAEAERLEGEGAPVPFGLGVDVTPDLAARARGAYTDALEKLLRPRLIYAVERKLARTLRTSAEPDERGALFEALKTYLMLSGAPGAELDADYLRLRLARDLGGEYGAAYPEEMAALFGGDGTGGHLDVLFAPGFLPPQPMDNELVDLSRDALTGITLAERAFRLIVSEAAARGEPGWSIARVAGSSADLALTRASGAPLSEEIPALFTRDGFWSVFLPNAALQVDDTLNEKWILLEENDRAAPRPEIVADMLGLYYEAYVDAWSAMLGDLRIAPFGDADSASPILGALASTARSPLRRVLVSAASETALSNSPAALGAIATDDKVGEELAEQADEGASRVLRGQAQLGKAALQAVLSGAGGREIAFGEPVDEAFSDLHAFVDGGEIDAVMLSLRGFHDRVAVMAQDGEDIRLLSTTPEAQALKGEAARAPRIVATVLNAMIENADAASSGGVRARLDELWRSTVLPACRQRLEGRYPFGDRGEVALGDLSALLAPGGTIDGFFKQNLALYVDNASWRLRPAGRALGLSQSVVDFFEESARLRAAFFPDGGRAPRFGMRVRLVTLDPALEAAEMGLGGTPARFLSAGNAVRPVPWPGAQPAAGAEIALSPPGGAASVTGENGQWGLFRLVDRLGFRAREGGAKGRVRAEVDGYSAVFEMQFESVDNPFALRDAIRRYRCPPGL